VTKKIVIKIGSSTLTTAEGKVDLDFLSMITAQIAKIKKAGWQPVIVTSAAIACGLEALGIKERPSDIPSLQAAASVGQNALATAYAKSFAPFGIVTSLVLLTRRETADRKSYLHARDTFQRLLDFDVVPIVNENDTVSVEQIRFGDNDTLAALVACLINADLVVVLSDIDGLYDKDPRAFDDAQIISQVSAIDQKVIGSAGKPGSAFGSGGMITKITAARVLMVAGIEMVICDGTRKNSLVDIVAGEAVGTRFVAAEKPHEITPRKLWIALGDSAKGTLVVDAGAKAALINQGGSLLSVGVAEIEGSFEIDDIVDIKDSSGHLFARGRVGIASTELTQSFSHQEKVGKTEKNSCISNGLSNKPIVHRDDLVIFE